jgi:hypothetical protein
MDFILAVASTPVIFGGYLWYRKIEAGRRREERASKKWRELSLKNRIVIIAAFLPAAFFLYSFVGTLFVRLGLITLPLMPSSPVQFIWAAAFAGLGSTYSIAISSPRVAPKMSDQ